jgi:hypothetical protein
MRENLLSNEESDISLEESKTNSIHPNYHKTHSFQFTNSDIKNSGELEHRFKITQNSLEAFRSHPGQNPSNDLPSKHRGHKIPHGYVITFYNY